MNRIYLLLFLLIGFTSCRKSIKAPDTIENKSVPIQFTASAYDAAATLNVQIYDNNTGHVYYTGTTSTNSYSGATDIQQGTTVTFVVYSSGVTNITSQIANNNSVVATGNYNAAQSQGQDPKLVLYYKVP
ncbi:hypothetical protein [Mucilaginibacter koreensis]